MRAIQVKCPQCGAVLDPGGDAERVKCTYCGATAVVEQGEPPVRHVPPGVSDSAAGLPRAASVRRKQSAAVRVGAAAIVLAVVGAAVAIWFAGRGEEQERLETTEWYGTTRALLADVNGDGVPEVLGRIRRLHLPGMPEALAALDARTGRKLWETPTLPAADGPHRTLAAAAGELLLFVDAGGIAYAYALADGKLRWEAQLGEAASAVFVLPDGTLHVSTIDGVLHGLAPDGSRRAIEEGGRLGRGVATDTHDPESFTFELPFELATAFEDRGLTAGSGIAGGAPGQTRLVLGQRARGTPVPMLGEAAADGTVLWTSDIPGVDPLAVASGSVDRGRIGVTADRVFVAYEGGTGPDERLQVTAFERATGRRLWEVDLPDPAPVSGLTVGDGVVFVSYWGQLAALDARTGKQIFLASPIR